MLVSALYMPDLLLPYGLTIRSKAQILILASTLLYYHNESILTRTEALVRMVR